MDFPSLGRAAAGPSVRAERVVDDDAPASVGLAAHHLGAAMGHLHWLAVRTGAFDPPCRAQQRDVAMLNHVLRLEFNLPFPREKTFKCRADRMGTLDRLRSRLGN